MITFFTTAFFVFNSWQLNMDHSHERLVVGEYIITSYDYLRLFEDKTKDAKVKKVDVYSNWEQKARDQITVFTSDGLVYRKANAGAKEVRMGTYAIRDKTIIFKCRIKRGEKKQEIEIYDISDISESGMTLVETGKEMTDQNEEATYVNTIVMEKF